MEEAEKIFNDKAFFNKWLRHLTESEKCLIIEMINDGLWKGYGYILGHNEEMEEAKYSGQMPNP